MSARNTHFQLGVMVLTGIGLAALAIIFFGAGTLFEPTIMMETYFDESVQGLNVGAAVMNRGVKVGTVKQIGFVRDEYGNSLKSERDIMGFGSYIIVKVAILETAPQLSAKELASLIKMRVDAGLRVRLVSQGITGIVNLEADYLDPLRFPPLPISWTPKTPYLPAAPSTITIFGKALDNIVRDLEHMEVAKVVKNIDKLVVSVSAWVDGTNLAQLSMQAGDGFSELKDTLQQARRLLEDPQITQGIGDAVAAAGQARSMMGELSAGARNIHEASESLPTVLARLDNTLRRIDHLMSSRGQEIEATIHNFKLISDNLRELTHNAKKYPAQILLGEPPSRSGGEKK